MTCIFNLRRGESTRWWNWGSIESLICVSRTFVTEMMVNRWIHLQSVMSSYWELIILELSSETGNIFDPWNQSFFFSPHTTRNKIELHEFNMMKVRIYIFRVFLTHCSANVEDVLIPFSSFSTCLNSDCSSSWILLTFS